MKNTFVKIAISFSSLIPCVIPPSDEREMTEGTPQQLRSSKKCVFLILLCLFHHYGRPKKRVILLKMHIEPCKKNTKNAHFIVQNKQKSA